MASVREIKADLETQLKAKGADTPTFKAMLDDYVFFYQQMKKAQADVRKNGLMQYRRRGKSTKSKTTALSWPCCTTSACLIF